MAWIETNAEGLTNHDAALRYATAGPNSVAEVEHRGLWRQLLPILVNPLSLLLLLLAIVNWITGVREGAVVIAATVVLSSLFTFVQRIAISTARGGLWSARWCGSRVDFRRQRATPHACCGTLGRAPRPA